jgi:hypothetical protein
MRRRLAAAVAIMAASATAAVLGPAAPPAASDIAHSQVVSANPVDYTPHVQDGTVRAFAVVGSKVVVGGNFTSVREAGKTAAIARNNIFAFDINTGKVDTAFVPKVDGTVYALEPGADSTVYVGGAFKNVNGSANRGLTRVRLSNGTRVGAFMGATLGSGTLLAMAKRGTALYVGGTFSSVAGVSRSRLARLNADTGKVDSGFNIPVTAPRSGTLKVQSMALHPNGSKLVINGTFTTVGGQPRHQIAVINSGTTASVSSWSTTEFNDTCLSQFDTYMRDMDFSPDGSFFVVVTTGGTATTSTLCDTASRWDANRTGAGQTPTWVNWTRGDTLLSVSVTGAAVYVGGHQRWHNQPVCHNGQCTNSPVERPGIAALNPTDGRALSWNPTRTRGHGVEDLQATSKGLLVGSDTEKLGNEWHQRLGMFPLS